MQSIGEYLKARYYIAEHAHGQICIPRRCLEGNGIYDHGRMLREVGHSEWNGMRFMHLEDEEGRSYNSLHYWLQIRKAENRSQLKPLEMRPNGEGGWVHAAYSYRWRDPQSAHKQEQEYRDRDRKAWTGHRGSVPFEVELGEDTMQFFHEFAARANEKMSSWDVYTFNEASEFRAKAPKPKQRRTTKPAPPLKPAGRWGAESDKHNRKRR